MSQFKPLRTVIRSLSLVVAALTALYIIPSVRPALSQQAGSTTNLDGTWKCTENCPDICEVKADAKIQQGADGSLTFTNECDKTAKGKFTNATRTKVEVSDWKNITADVKESGKKLEWSNGSIWAKQP